MSEVWSRERPISPFPPSVNQRMIETRSGIYLEIWALVKHGKLVEKKSANLCRGADTSEALPSRRAGMHPLTASLSL